MMRRAPRTPEQRREKHQRRRKKMLDMGVKKARHLSFIPLLLAALLVIVWLKLPSYATYQFTPAPLSGIPPMSGVAVSARSEPSEAQGLQLVYAQLAWRDFEPEKGAYDFERFEAENHFDQWREMGVGIVLNFCMDTAQNPAEVDLPDWLYEAIDGDGVSYQVDGMAAFSPNYANALLRERHHAAVLALGDRYDGDPAIAVVEVGSIGRDGLWQLPQEQEWPPASVMTGYAHEYANAFMNTPLTCAVRYNEFAAMGIGCLNVDAADVSGSWRWINRNLYGGYDERIRQEVLPVDSALTRGAWGAHIAGNVRVADLSPGEFEGLLQRLKEGKASYLYGADISDLSEDRRLLLNNTLGYTLWLRQVQMPTQIRANHRLRLNMAWQNDGSSAMVCDWPLEIALYRDGERVFAGEADIDLRTLQPGRTDCYVTVDLPPDIPDGEYDVTVAILRPGTQETAVELAMDCGKVDGRSIIGRLSVH